MKLPSKILNAFTLVELLIVIVIIGILMSALLPRLQGAQDLARDTSRGVAMNQLQTAISSYRALRGSWPSKASTSVTSLTSLIQEGILTDFPLDPIELVEYTATVSGSKVPGSGGGAKKDFLYLVVKKNGGTSGAIVLATRMETPGRANYVSKLDNVLDINGDFKNIYPCKTVTLDESKNNTGSQNKQDADCNAQHPEQLRYITKF